MFKGLKDMLGSQAGRPPSADDAPATGESRARPSNGLDQFFSSVRGQSGLNLLDFAGATQANISFITSLGHRLSSEDFVRSLEQVFGKGADFYENQADPRRCDEFLEQNLNFPAEVYDGALIWDGLQFLTPHLLQITVDRLYDTLRPNSLLLAFFHSDEKARNIPLYQYRITDEKMLLLAPRGSRQPAQFFNNRGLEKLFQRFQSVKFFLTRDNLREVIVKR